MIYYLTYNDQPSGIYSSQVIDVVKYLRGYFELDIKLVAIVSIKGYFKNRSLITRQLPGSIVVPMFPRMKNWRMNRIALIIVFALKRPVGVICRNAIPTQLALFLKRKGLVKKVVYDARGAEFEQLREYAIISDQRLINEVYELEKSSCLDSDFQMAVTQSLINYWKEEFGYNRQTNVVIPCTLNNDNLQNTELTTNVTRANCGFQDNDLVVVYSGSVSGWQSFNLLLQFYEKHLKEYSNLRLLLLTKQSAEVNLILEKHKSRVIQKWCSENEVQHYLSLADYGMMLREDTITNRVASPVKFAEYLSAGLEVIISSNIVDYADFVVEHSCGQIYTGNVLSLEKLSSLRKEEIRRISERYLNKSSEIIRTKYMKVIENLQ